MAKLNDSLNSCGDGPVKDIDAWSLTGTVVVKAISEVSELGTYIIDSPENAEMENESVSIEIINDSEIFDCHGNQEEYLLSDVQFELLQQLTKIL
ncbi:hypothetical protein FQR65_LT19736 [Abscondita terminalis]|nr:hypothetical protein FQR65_LT19736 [Abscondita terminalis]